MQAPVLCRDCGAENSPFADLCEECYRELEPTTRVVPPPPPSTRVPQKEWTPTYLPLGSALPAAGTSNGLLLRTIEPIRWRWTHLVAFLGSAWGIPFIWGLNVDNSGSLSQILDTSLLVQIVGYVIAAVIAGFLVVRVQNGDWSTLGLTRDGDSLGEGVWGAAFGLLLLGAFIPFSIAINGGEFSMDGVVKLYVGSTSGIGLLFAGVVLVIGAPLIEEIFFRGMLYEKIKRQSPGAAIGVTSLLFVLAHGSIVILPLWLLALGLAIARHKGKTLWFTIGAHSAWNFAILLIAAFIVFAPNVEFAPADGAYAMRHPSGWERAPELEGYSPAATIDFVAQTTDGSLVDVARISMPAGSTHEQVPDMLGKLQRDMAMGTATQNGPAVPSQISFNTFSPVYESSATIHFPDGTTARSRAVAVLPRGETHLYVFGLICPSVSCAEADEEFDRFLTTVSFAP